MSVNSARETPAWWPPPSWAALRASIWRIVCTAVEYLNSVLINACTKYTHTHTHTHTGNVSSLLKGPELSAWSGRCGVDQERWSVYTQEAKGRGRGETLTMISFLCRFSMTEFLFSWPTSRIFSAVPRPSMLSLACTLHDSHATQSMISLETHDTRRESFNWRWSEL